MDITKDYYSVLGILPSAEVGVVKAAYKAMMKVYHPDRYAGSKEEAHQRCLEIGEAHTILSDSITRAAYDEARQQSREEASYAHDEAEASKESDSAAHTLDYLWGIATKYQHDLVCLEDDLKSLSPKLAFAFAFRVKMLESKRYNDAQSIAKEIEHSYMTTYFGHHPIIMSFAKELLLAGNRDGAKELNRAITIFGSDILPEQVIKQIRLEFNQKSTSVWDRTDRDPWEPKVNKDNKDNKANDDNKRNRLLVFRLSCLTGIGAFIMLLNADNLGAADWGGLGLIMLLSVGVGNYCREKQS